MSRRHLVMAGRNLINVYNKFPKELFRVNSGTAVKLRVFKPGRDYFDFVTEDGLVVPKALDPSTYRGLSPFQFGGEVSRLRPAPVLAAANLASCQPPTVHPCVPIPGTSSPW